MSYFTCLGPTWGELTKGAFWVSLLFSRLMRPHLSCVVHHRSSPGLYLILFYHYRLPCTDHFSLLFCLLVLAQAVDSTHGEERNKNKELTSFIKNPFLGNHSYILLDAKPKRLEIKNWHCTNSQLNNKNALWKLIFSRNSQPDIFI